MTWRLTFDVDGQEHVIMMPGRMSQRRASRTAAKALSFEHKVKKHHIFLKTIKGV